MKMVILGSCRFCPYEILKVPEKVPGLWNTEEGYKKAAEAFYPAMQAADMVMVWNPDGIGEHTQRDIDEAKRLGKPIYIIVHQSALVEKNALLESYRAEVERLKTLVTDQSKGGSNNGNLPQR